jgi:hypothetical protein
MRTQYIINNYPIREVIDSITTSKGFWMFKWDGRKYWRTPDKIYRVAKGYGQWFELTELEVHHKNCNIRDSFKYDHNFFDSI